MSDIQRAQRILHIGLSVLVAPVYYLTLQLGLISAFTPTDSSISLVWPATAIAVLAALFLGRSAWPGIWTGVLAGNLFDLVINGETNGLGIAFMIAFGNLGEAVTGAYLIKSFCWGKRPLLATVNYLWCGLLACGVAATLGVMALIAGGAADRAMSAILWRDWMIGDGGGWLMLGAGLGVWHLGKKFF